MLRKPVQILSSSSFNWQMLYSFRLGDKSSKNFPDTLPSETVMYFAFISVSLVKKTFQTFIESCWAYWQISFSASNLRPVWGSHSIYTEEHQYIFSKEKGKFLQLEEIEPIWQIVHESSLSWDYLHQMPPRGPRSGSALKRGRKKPKERSS